MLPPDPPVGAPGSSTPAGLQERALQASATSFTIADARAEGLPLVYVNPAFTVTTGYPADEALGRNCRFLQGPGTDPAAVQRLRDALSGGVDLTLVLRNYRRDGTPFWNEVSISPVRDGSGALTHVVGVQADVTARVDAQHAQAAALDAERVALDQAQAAREEAEGSADRLATLVRASGVLAATLDVDASLDGLTRLLVPHLADWALLCLADDDGRVGGHGVGRHRDGRVDEVLRLGRMLGPGTGPGADAQAVLDGADPVLRGPWTGASEATALAGALGSRSVLVVPLLARRRRLGVMLMGRGGPDFGDDDLRLAADLGRRAGLAVDNARLYAREHRTALTLQRGLLPQLPDVPGLVLAAEYLPAAQENEIGGDWWDVFALPDGATGLAVGDVMGHDLSAAAAMGQLRSVLRTAAWDGDGPAQVLERMDQLVQSFDMAQLATCVYARLLPPDGPDAPDGSGRRRLARLQWANAGHLPPVLLTPDGQARLLDAAVSVPIGVPGGGPVTAADVAVPHGSTVLLYTDGLVETRRGDIDDDVERLRRLVAEHDPADHPRVLVDRLTAHPERLTDDVALLAVQVR